MIDFKNVMTPEAQAVLQLGVCVGVLKEAARVLEADGNSATAKLVRDTAKEADAIWSRCIHPNRIEQCLEAGKRVADVAFRGDVM